MMGFDSPGGPGPGTAPKTVRIFISSTFRDMHAERDQLSRVVFPELRSRCLKRGADFIGFDLRWGVTEEEAEQQGALAICLEEIERCRPFFVCLLGDRFGWVPPPEEVPAPAFDQVHGAGVLPPEIAWWYRLDESAVPPVYRLRRDQKLPDDLAEELPRFWESQGLPLAGESITAREILRGGFEHGDPAPHAFFYLRQGGFEEDRAFPESFLPVFAEQDEGRRAKLLDLKRRIEGASGHLTVRSYAAGYTGLRIDPAFLPPGLSAAEREALGDGVIASDQWPQLSDAVRRAFVAHGTVSLAGMEDLGQRILDDLWPAIEAELERPVDALDAHQRERAYHERFVAGRTRLFLGRSNELAQVMAYLGDAPDRNLLVVTGEPGAGKSAFIAECARLCRERHPAALVVPHFIGAAPGSAALPTTLRSLCETLRQELALEVEVETDPLKLRLQLASFLEQAGARRPVFLFLDALNQLDPARSHELDWLPFVLPPGTKLVASTLAGEWLERLQRRIPEDHLVVVPALPEDDRRLLVERFLVVRRKKLTAAQLASILDTSRRPDAGLPLYLLVALEELCLFGDHEALSQRIDRFPERLPELFDQILARLEQDHGRATTEPVCSWIAVSRSGLLESEALELLAAGGTFPRVRWTRLYRGLEPYLVPVEEAAGTEGDGAGQLDFYHDQLRLAVYRRYLGMPVSDAEPSEACRGVHRQLADYFLSIAKDGTLPDKWRTDRARSLSELPFHLTRGEMWDGLAEALCDLRFIEARCSVASPSQLIV
ncbi:MAG TPA: AAA family ATPase, partial [Thermoanaerobaculia bacterium]